MVSGVLWFTSQNVGGSWAPYAQVPVPINVGAFSGVSCAPIDGDLHVVALQDGDLWHGVRHANGLWSAFEKIQTLLQDGRAFTAFSCGAVGETGVSDPKVHVMALQNMGDGNVSVVHTYLSPHGTWSPFIDVTARNSLPGFSGISCSGGNMNLTIAGLLGGKVWVYQTTTEMNYPDIWTGIDPGTAVPGSAPDGYGPGDQTNSFWVATAAAPFKYSTIHVVAVDIKTLQLYGQYRAMTEVARGLDFHWRDNYIPLSFGHGPVGCVSLAYDTSSADSHKLSLVILASQQVWIANTLDSDPSTWGAFAQGPSQIGSGGFRYAASASVAGALNIVGISQ